MEIFPLSTNFFLGTNFLYLVLTFAPTTLCPAHRATGPCAAGPALRSARGICAVGRAAQRACSSVSGTASTTTTDASAWVACVSMSTKEALLGEFDLAMGPQHKGLYVHDATDKRPIDSMRERAHDSFFLRNI